MPEKPWEDELRALAEELKDVRKRTQRLRDRIPISPQETGPGDIDQPDETTLARSTLECVLADHLDLALADFRGLLRSLSRKHREKPEPTLSTIDSRHKQ